MDVIDDLVVENRELRDVLIQERNAQYWNQQDDMVVDAAIRGDVARMKSRLELAYALIIVLVALLLSVYFQYAL